MENNNLEIPNNNGFDPINNILQCYNEAMLAFQMQDLERAEHAFRSAKMTQKNAESKVTEDDKIFFIVMVGYIELCSHFLRSNVYFTDERFKKANEEYVAAEALSKQIMELINTLDPEFIQDYSDEISIPMIKFLVAYLEQLIVVMHGISEKSQEKNEGKFVDDELLHRQAADRLREFNFQEYYFEEQAMNNMVSNCVGLLNRIADSYEKKADRIEEKKKDIEYLKPIDKRIFIVHGHGEERLKELENILIKKFKIDPIVLRDETDRGKTIIEKIEDYGRQSAFAFVLITPDDLVKNQKTKTFQARPNVLFELGWFCGRYGRGSVRIIRHVSTQLPSDLGGLVTYDFEEKIEEVAKRIESDLRYNYLI